MARIAIANSKKAVNFDNDLQIERDLLVIMNAVRLACSSLNILKSPKIISYIVMTMLDIDTLEKDNKILRAAMLKKRYANVIMKSQKQVLGKAFDEKNMKKKAALWEKQLHEEKVKLREKDRVKLREKDREVAQIAIASIKRTVNFGDGLEAERDLMSIIGAPNRL
ncbi:hypothetical protein RDI58_022577 [Solanum bulbocastanum]|uniref:Uncharacterized protein n=1 Tax=Solanum bulbocastanum TaxID=147425 RepID=A0AAN8T2C6_SOLBU